MQNSKHPQSVPRTGPYRRYAVRRTNPFLGVLQVIETPDGRGLSTNGVVWEIEIKVNQPAGWGSLNQDNYQTIYYRIGLWSEEEGLVKGPLAPHMTMDLVTEQSGSLIEHIRDNLQQLPFKLIDQCELWLFDADNEYPLALLDSMIPGDAKPSPEARYWQASLGAHGLPGQHRFDRSNELEIRVKKRAGFNLNKYWVQRQQDGSGITEIGNRVIPVDDFPVFLLRQDWPEAEVRMLVQDFIDWTAPALLTLQHLQQRERAALETSLMKQAVSIEYHWHLYPEIIDQASVDAARVKNQLLSVGAQEG